MPLAVRAPILTPAMRNSMALTSIFFLLFLATRAHGLRRLEMQLHAALDKKEETPDYSKWQTPSGARPMNTRRASDGHRGLARTAGEQPVNSAHGAAEDVEEVKMMMRARAVAPRVHEDYVGPSGHSPNHHRTNPCGPC